MISQRYQNESYKTKKTQEILPVFADSFSVHLPDPLNKSFCQSFPGNRFQLFQKVNHVTEFLVETKCIFIDINVVNLNFVI